MGSHHPAVVPTDDGRWVGKCTCRWRAPDVCATSQEAEDSNLRHLKEVDRQRAYTRKSEPSLKNMRDYYRSMAEAEFDPYTKGLWELLAEEIDHRLNDSGPPNEGQDQLW